MTAPLRFCLVTTFYPPYHHGGDGVFVHRLAQALAARGHTVDVVHSVDAHRISRNAPQKDFVDAPGIRRIPLETRAPLLSALAVHQLGNPAPYRRQLREVLAPGRYDVIHFHNISLMGGPAVLRCGDGIKLYTTHEYWLVCPTHVLFRFEREACVKRHCISCTVRALRPPQMWRSTPHLRRCLAQVDRLLIPSRFAMERHRADGIVAPMELLPSFVPIPEEPVAPTATGEPYFLFVGRLEKLKGLQDLLPMLRAFPAARLRVVGGGSYEPRLRQLAGGMTNVEFCGRLHPSRIAELYRGALAVLAPSLCYEVFPLAPVEALAHGVPVIARRIGALADVITDSGGGLLFNTPQECRDAMERLLAEPQLRDELGQRGRRMACAHWTEEEHMTRYLHVIRTLQESRTKSPGRAHVVSS